jgi:ligand-binding sensor domain-containing protein/signal transduction histidine kinase
MRQKTETTAQCSENGKPLYTQSHCPEQSNVPNHRWLFPIACVLLCANTILAGAASDAIRETKYSIHVWENDHGLPHDTVVSMVQTRDGYLWLGTLGGLARFDGIRFSSIPGLSDTRVVYLFEDSHRNLWIGTESAGTMIMREGRLIAPPELAAGGIERRLRAACEDASGTVWLYYENGDLWRYAANRFVPMVPPREESSTRTMIQETNGPLWVGTLRHQYAVGAVVENGSLELPIGEDISFAIRLEMLVASRRSGYWRLANGQIQRVDAGTVRTITPYRWPVEVTSACEDHDGNLVVGTKGAGVFLVHSNGTVSSLTTTQKPSANLILSVLVDREGTLWVGTDGGGLNRVKRQLFTTLESSRGWEVQSVTEDATGGLWLGSYFKGLGRWASGQMEQFGSSRYSLFERAVPIQTVFADRENRVWVGTADRQLLQFRDGAFHGVNDGGLIQQKVQAIYQDRVGRLWFGTEGSLVCLESNKWRLFGAPDGLISTNITAIADDADGNIWIGTVGGGVNRWRDGKFSPLLGAPAEYITALLTDAQGVLWVATRAGLGRWQKETWTRYTTREGLVTDNLRYLIDDGLENLWIGSDIGVLRVPKKALNDFAGGQTNAILCRAYDKEDGLPTRACTLGSQPGGWRGRDGALWFATMKGVARLDPAQFRANTNPPPVVIESILVDDVKLGSNDVSNLTLRPHNERLEIQYSSLNLAAPERARFRYRLEGLEKNWIEAGDRRPVSYPKLPAGRYTFQVTASNEDGVWNESGASLAVVVQPPFWRTWWFITISILGTLGLIAGTVHYFSTQQLQRQLAVMQQQEALEKERARIARDIHDQVGASLTQVALLGELVESDKNSPAEIEAHAQQISQTARETTRALDEIVWTVNPQNDTLEGLVNYICKYAQDYLAVAGVTYRFDLPSQLPAQPIAPDVRHNVFLASKEAVTNIVRHGNATSAWIRLRVELPSVILEIEDNGRGIGGLDSKAAQTRHGLKNMRKRMEDIGGHFHIGSGREGGALVRLTIPLTAHHAIARAG